ncbi:hypothetical protein [Archangium primigenium]|uniref:hypothetical protein n=1 Tax=[Archangium] primigenium TaxID=2792470 RepID=UPI001957E371|nr:hypothetical protein [Archangium primigenium]MBM7117658.1 hypothetical protein [Archangium primigenium]
MQPSGKEPFDPNAEETLSPDEKALSDSNDEEPSASVRAKDSNAWLAYWLIGSGMCVVCGLAWGGVFRPQVGAIGIVTGTVFYLGGFALRVASWKTGDRGHSYEKSLSLRRLVTIAWSCLCWMSAGLAPAILYPSALRGPRATRLEEFGLMCMTGLATLLLSQMAGWSVQHPERIKMLLAFIGIHSKSMRREAHQDMLAMAQDILGKFPEPERSRSGEVYFDVRSYPLEFRLQAAETLRDLLWHCELPQIKPKKLGNSAVMRDLSEGIELMKANLSGIYSPHSRLRARALFYAEIFALLKDQAKSVEESPGMALYFMKSANAEDGLTSTSRLVLSWFPTEASLEAARRALGGNDSIFRLEPRADAIALLNKLEVKSEELGLSVRSDKDG